jgi:2'-5' RNA ligase
MADLLYLMGFLGDTPPVGEYCYDPDNLHLTLMPEHAVPDKHLVEYVTGIGNVVRWFQPFSIEPDYTDFYGAEGQIPVTVMKQDRNVFELHQSLLHLGLAYGMKVEASIIGEKFSPHISYYTESKPAEVKSLSLIHHRSGFGVDVVNLANYSLGVGRL